VRRCASYIKTLHKLIASPESGRCPHHPSTWLWLQPKYN